MSWWGSSLARGRKSWKNSTLNRGSNVGGHSTPPCYPISEHNKYDFTYEPFYKSNDPLKESSYLIHTLILGPLHWTQPRFDMSCVQLKLLAAMKCFFCRGELLLMPLELLFEALYLEIQSLSFPLSRQLLLDTGVQLGPEVGRLEPLRNHLIPGKYAHLCKTSKLQCSSSFL